MSNLEQKITQWRQQMLAAGIESPVPLEELETHLREEIGQQMKSGRGEAEAFESAVQIIGQAHKVHGEFKKIVPVNGAFDWKLMEILFGLVASIIPLFFCSTILRFKYGALTDLTPGQQISGVAAVVVFALFAWSGRLGYKMFPVVPSKRTRSIITTFCCVPVMAWWIIFMNFIVPCHDFTMGQFVIAFLWAFSVPAGPMIGLTWGIEAAARKRMTIGMP